MRSRVRRILRPALLFGLLLSLLVAFSPLILDRLILTDSSTISDLTYWNRVTAGKMPALRALIPRLQNGGAEAWIGDAAPVMWWHPDERYRASDPLPFYRRAELWYREVNPLFPFWTTEETRIPVGAPGEILHTRYRGASASQVVTRLFERQGLKAGHAGFELRYDVDLPAPGPAPLLWRLSLSPLFREVQPAEPGRLLVPVEFWYHVAHNPVTIYLGTHAGDWESFLVVFDVRAVLAAPAAGTGPHEITLKAVPAYYNTSAHGGASWHCADEMLYRNGRVQLFSALGTHATYSRPGVHWRVYPDRTAAGLAWDTRALLRPVVREPYYGFSGSWGKTSFVHFMNGPIPPGPAFKYLPRARLEQSRADWALLQARCAHAGDQTRH